MRSIRILGIGSFSGADQVGLLVIKRIKAKLQDHPANEEVDIDFYDRPGMHLIELIKEAEIVHLIDAMMSAREEGFIHRYTDINVFQAINHSLSSHGYGVAEALQLAKVMGSLPNQLVIHGVEISKEKKLTPNIIQACTLIAEQIIAEVLLK